MKKVLFIAVVAVASLASCKKDRTCTCTSTTAGVAGTPQVITYTEAKKGDARANCLSSTRTSTYSGASVTTTTTCELK